MRGAAALKLEVGQRTLGALARAIGARCSASAVALPIDSLCTDSRRAEPGCLFFAVPGSAQDGARFIGEALARGAVALAGLPETTLPETAASVPFLAVAEVRRAKAIAAHAFHGDPSASLTCIGITGTKGKTTTAMLVHSVLAAAELKPTLLGTIEERVFGQPTRPAEQTTPDSLRLAELLAMTRDAGGASCVMEASSHALDQERTTGVRFRAGVFTQLACEHLDYHHTIAAYRDAKARLFTALAPDAVAVVNAEDATWLELLDGCRARVVTYGQVPGAHVTADQVRSDANGTRLRLRHDGRSFEVVTALVGRHNCMNVLAACATGLALDLAPDVIVRGIAALCSVPGRLERVTAGQDFEVFVDYAHTDDSLEKVLYLLRPITRGRLITVFGCGGNRDTDKRPRMGRVAARWSDRLFVTSDNPRDEEPAEIARQVLAGVPAGTAVAVELDRRSAIELALAQAKSGDVVLIAGKGHEDHQIVRGRKLPFDDRRVAKEALCRRSS